MDPRSTGHCDIRSSPSPSVERGQELRFAADKLNVVRPVRRHSDEVDAMALELVKELIDRKLGDQAVGYWSGRWQRGAMPD
jgi:hypothetical protein